MVLFAQANLHWCRIWKPVAWCEKHKIQIAFYLVVSAAHLAESEDESAAARSNDDNDDGLLLNPIDLIGNLLRRGTSFAFVSWEKAKFQIVFILHRVFLDLESVVNYKEQVSLTFQG